MRRLVLTVFLMILASSEYLSQVAARSQTKENETEHQSQDYTRTDGDHGTRRMRRAHVLKTNIGDNIRMHDQKGLKGVSNGHKDRRAGIVPVWPPKNSWVEGSIYKKLGKQRKVQGFPKKVKLHNICFFSMCNFGEADKNKQKKTKKKKSKENKKNNNNENDNYNHGIHDSNNNIIDTKYHPNDNHHIPDTYDHHNDNYQDPYHISENIPDSLNNYAPNEPHNHSPETIPNSNNNFASDSKKPSVNSPENSPPFNNNFDKEPSGNSLEKNPDSHNNFVPTETPNDNFKRSTRAYNTKYDFDPRYYFHSPENTHEDDNFDPKRPYHNHSPENTPHKYKNFDPKGPYNHSPENTPHKYDNFDPDVPHYQGDGGENFGLDDTHASMTDDHGEHNDILKITQKKNGHLEDIKETTKNVNPKCNNPYVLEGMECETTFGPLDPEVVEKQRQKHLEFKNKHRQRIKESEKKMRNSYTDHNKYKIKKHMHNRRP